MAVYNSGRGERVVSAGIGVGMPSSRREIEEDILEELCHMAQRRSCFGVGDISEVLKDLGEGAFLLSSSDETPWLC